MQPRRPGVVTFIGIVLYIQGFLAAIAAVMLIAYQSRISDIVQQQTGTAVSDSSLLASGIVEAVIAVLLIVVAAGLMAGRRGYRTFVAVVEAVRMGAALWVMLFHHGGAFVDAGVVTLLIGVFVLWALYGHDKSEAYFEAS